MNIEEIKLLIQLMIENDLGELNIADGDKKISLKRGAASAPVVVSAPAAVPAAVIPAVAPADNMLEIRSPMVGTFYAASSPDSEPFAKVGSPVGDDTPVCIIEAMKVMNEIKSDVSGVIAEVCVKNAQPVEFGQILFRVKPA